MIGCREPPHGSRWPPPHAPRRPGAEAGRCGGSMCSEAEWRRRGRLHVLDNVRLYCTAVWVSRGRLITAIPEASLSELAID